MDGPPNPGPAGAPSQDAFVVSGPSVEALLAPFPPERTWLLPALQSVQAARGWLSLDDLAAVGAHLHVPQSEVYGVATHYPELRLAAPGHARREVDPVVVPIFDVLAGADRQPGQDDAEVDGVVAAELPIGEHLRPEAVVDALAQVLDEVAVDVGMDIAHRPRSVDCDPRRDHVNSFPAVSRQPSAVSHQ